MAQPDQEDKMLAQQQRRKRTTVVLTGLHYFLLPATYLLFLPARWLMRQLRYEQRFMFWWSRMIRESTGMRKAFDGYEPLPQDVFICSYFKSGTNWAMQIAYQIATHGQGEFTHVHDVIAWPDSPSGYAIPLSEAPIIAGTDRRVIKTHLALDRIPFSPQARYIAVVRDPKDAFVSGFHFTRDVMFGPLMFTLSDFLDYFLDDDFIFEAWWHFANSYWQVRHCDNVLFLTYEEMINDLPGAVRRIAELMDITLSEAEFAQVCEKSSFAYMKVINHQFYPGRMTPWSNPNGKMMRQGKVGSASELLTPEQQQRIDDHFRARLQQAGSDFPYATSFKTN